MPIIPTQPHNTKITDMKTTKQYKRSVRLLLLILLTACSDHPAPDAQSLAEIRLFTELPASDGSALNGLAGHTVAFAAGNAAGAYSEVWEAKANGNEAAFIPPRYYPDNNSRLHLRGYYPAVPLGAGGVAFLLDGAQDVLVSDPQHGCLTDMFRTEAKRFTFGHLLMQLNIRLRVTDGYPAGATLKRVRLGGSRVRALLNLDKGSLAFSGETQPLSILKAEGEGAPLGTAWPDTLIGPVMAEPGVPLTLEVTVGIPGEADRLYPALPIRFVEADGLPKAGTAYTLSVTLGTPDIPPGETLLSATVAEWVKGNEGAGVIDDEHLIF